MVWSKVTTVIWSRYTSLLCAVVYKPTGTGSMNKVDDRKCERGVFFKPKVDGGLNQALSALLASLALSFFARCTCFFSSFSWAIFCFFSSISFNSCSLNGQLFGIPGSFLDSRGKLVWLHTISLLTFHWNLLPCLVGFFFASLFNLRFFSFALFSFLYRLAHDIRLLCTSVRWDSQNLSSRPWLFPLHISLKKSYLTLSWTHCAEDVSAKGWFFPRTKKKKKKPALVLRFQIRNSPLDHWDRLKLSAQAMSGRFHAGQWQFQGN